MKSMAYLSMVLLLLGATGLYGETVSLTQTYDSGPVVGTNNVESLSNVTTGSWEPCYSDLGSYLCLATANAASNGYIVYRFPAPTGWQFSGNFNVNIAMAARKYYGGTSSVAISYKLDDSTDYTELEAVSSADLPADGWDSFSGTLSFDAQSAHNVYVKIELSSTWYNVWPQVGALTISGTCESLPTSGSISLVQTYASTPVAGSDYVSEVSGVSGGIFWNGANLFSEDDDGGDGLCLSPTLAPGGGDVVYQFDAPTGNLFYDNFEVNVMMGVRSFYGTDWGTVDVFYKTNNDADWTLLKDVTIRNGNAWDGVTSYADLYAGPLSFDAMGAQTVYIKFDLSSRYVNLNAQLARAEFTGNYGTPSAEAPVFVPAGQNTSGATLVTITSATAGATIYYTIDGKTPTVAGGLLYTPGTSITVNPRTSLKAIAVLAGGIPSAVTSYVPKLVDVESRSGTVTTTPNGSLDYVMQNGTVHVNAGVYKTITLSGTVSNWTGYTDGNWKGSWGFISLMGSDYFANRSVPANVDETTANNVFTHVGDTNYGDDPKQRGFAANGGFVFYKTIDSGLGGFAAEDCANGGSHKAEMGSSFLADPTQYAYEVVYDLDSMKMTVKIKDIGDTSWDAQATVDLGDRNITGSDDFLDVVSSVQMSDNLPTVGGAAYGFNYTIKMTLANPINGDANFDGMVDVGDLGILAANYGASGKTWAQGDFNGDGAVDVGDLGILAANYGRGASGTADFDADYAKVFGTTESSSQEDSEGASSLCSTLGFSLIAGLALMGLLLVKLED